MQKCAKKCKKLSNIEKFFLIRFAHAALYKIHIYEAAHRHAPVQYAKYFFLFSKKHDMDPLLHLYHFRKKYDYILVNINSESSRVRFSLFLSSSSGSNIFVPQQIL